MTEKNQKTADKKVGNSAVAKTEDTRYLSFSLGAEDFAVPLLNVREVIGVPECTSLPFTPEYVLGIMNVRGQVITVIDLRKRLGMSIDKLTHESAVVVCEMNGVNQVLSPKSDELHEKPEVEKNSRSEYIEKIFRRDRHLVMFLDVSKILDVDRFIEFPVKSAS